VRRGAKPRARRRIDARHGSDILRAATPRAWVDAALADLPTLARGSRQLREEGASTAMALIFAYPEDRR
jgi:tRNA isopentenyl-2-thiomethyl-A-37 hydroxylase MiaE